MNLSKSNCEEWKKDPSKNPLTGRTIDTTGQLYKKINKECKEILKGTEIVADNHKNKYGFSKEDCDKWKNTPLENPLTGRAIEATGNVYKKLVNGCKEYGDYKQTINDKKPMDNKDGKEKNNLNDKNIHKKNVQRKSSNNDNNDNNIVFQQTLPEDIDELYKQAKKAFEDGNKERLVAIKKKIDQLNVKHESPSSEFVPYPSSTNANFNQILTNKLEFNKQRYKRSKQSYEQISKGKCSSTQFILSNNQKFLKNFMSPLTPYNSLLIFHKTGVGKSCSAISIAEQFIGVFKKKVFVLLSTNLRDNFKKQLFDLNKVSNLNMPEESSPQCTGMKYLDLVPGRSSMEPKELKSKIKKIIKERYEFMGFIEFAHDYTKMLEEIKKTEKDDKRADKLFNQKLREVYSDRIFIIDEVHNLRNSSKACNKEVPPKVERVLSVAQNVKLLMMTATPMFNNADEIVWLMNYLLLNDKQPLLDKNVIFKDEKLTKTGEIKLIEASRGRVSYMRGDNPYAFPFRLYPSINPNGKDIIFGVHDKPTIDIFGDDINETNHLEDLELVKSYMSDYQAGIYMTIENDFEHVQHDDNFAEEDEEGEADEEDVEEEVESKDINKKKLVKKDKSKKNIRSGVQLSNIVYPGIKGDTTSQLNGMKGFKRNFIISGSANQPMKITYVKGIDQFLHPSQIANYAPKIKTIIDFINNCEGIVYVYSYFLISGIVPLALGLEHCGFNKYNGNNIFKSKKDLKIEKGALVGNKSPNYIILSANSRLSPGNDAEIAVAKSKENANGELIKVIIGSNVATEGIDFKNIREIHILEPWYHLNKIEQIIGRGIRNCSHVDLPLARRNTTIYKHVNTRHNSKKETIDVRNYRISDRKQTQISKVENILAGNSIDCRLNREVLLFPKSVVGEEISLRTSQGNLIPYKIGDDPKTHVVNCIPTTTNVQEIIKIDTSTFNLAFLNDDVDIYIAYVSPLFRLKLFWTYDEILKQLKSHKEDLDEDILKYGLEVMLSEKRRIVDSKGKQGYLIYRSNKYIFQDEAKQDRRMTLEEREIDLNKKRIVNLEVFKTEKENPNLKNIDIRKNVTQAEDSQINDVKVLKKSVQEIANETHIQHLNVIYDYVIDRLTQIEMSLIVKEIYNSFDNGPLDDNKKHILKSLISGSIILCENVENISNIGKPDLKYFVDIHADEKTMYYKFTGKSTVLKQLPPSENNNIKALITALTNRLKLEHVAKDGYVAIDKKIVFKTIENTEGTTGNSKGSICTQNSKLHMNTLKDRVMGVVSGANSNLTLPPGMKKHQLCRFYELVLRLYRPNRFVRPYHNRLLD